MLIILVSVGNSFSAYLCYPVSMLVADHYIVNLFLRAVGITLPGD